MRTDVVIVGAGPAGIMASIEIAKQGGKVIVIDDNMRPGGKLLGQLHEEPKKQQWWKGAEIANKLVEQAIEVGVTFMNQTQVYAIENKETIQIWTIFLADTLNRPLQTKQIEAKAVLLATGGVEKPIPIPGWTLPGVMTVGAAQVLTNVYRVKPGKKVILIGIDALSLTIARAMKLAGVEVVGIVLPPKNEFTKGKSEPKNILKQLLSMAHLSPNGWMKLGGKLFNNPFGIKIGSRFFPKDGVKVWGISIRVRKAIVSIHGEDHVSSVKIASIDINGNSIPGSETEIPVDAVCISGGLTPLIELTTSLGCKFVGLEGLSGVVPLHGRELETTVSSLFVAGNITGIEGAKVAMAQGELAGKSICYKLGIGSYSDLDIENAIIKVNQTRENADIQFHQGINHARMQMQILWEQEMQNTLR